MPRNINPVDERLLRFFGGGSCFRAALVRVVVHSYCRGSSRLPSRSASDAEPGRRRRPDHVYENVSPALTGVGGIPGLAVRPSVQVQV